jgi:hypothetical protein
MEVTLLEKGLKLLGVRGVLGIRDDEREGEFSHIALGRQKSWLGWGLGYRGIALS